jgi:hypothetical protein
MHRLLLALSLGALLALTACAGSQAQTIVCDRSYPDTCIFPPLPDLDCLDIPHRQFKVLPPDSHRFDRTSDGLGCTSADMRNEQAKDA